MGSLFAAFAGRRCGAPVILALGRRSPYAGARGPSGFRHVGLRSLALFAGECRGYERGGAAALHLMVAGGEVMRTLPESFDDWMELLWTIAPHGNAALVAFIRSSPSFFQTIALTKDKGGAEDLAHRVLTLTREVGRVDSESALACLRSSAKA